jgi:hypothetical protein
MNRALYVIENRVQLFDTLMMYIIYIVIVGRTLRLVLLLGRQLDDRGHNRLLIHLHLLLLLIAGHPRAMLTPYAFHLLVLRLLLREKVLSLQDELRGRQQVVMIRGQRLVQVLLLLMCGMCEVVHESLPDEGTPVYRVVVAQQLLLLLV